MLTDIGVSFPFSKASSMAFTAASCAKSFAKSFDPDFNVLKRVAHPHSDSQISQQAKIAKRKHLYEESDPGRMLKAKMCFQLDEKCAPCESSASRSLCALLQFFFSPEKHLKWIWLVRIILLVLLLTVVLLQSLLVR